ISGAAILGKERRGHCVHALVRALGRENRRDQKFERVPEIEFTVRVRINFRERFHQFLDSFARGHFATLSGWRPRARATIARARATARCAQANSVARIARPIGMTMKAGPGRTINATPIKRTVPPMSAMMSLRNGAATILNADQKRESQFIRRYVAALG